MASDDSVVTFAYDSVSRPILEDQDALEVTRTLDGVGNLATLTYPNGREITRTDDALGRLTCVTDASGTVQSYAYDGTPLVSKTLGNGVTTTLSYDDALRQYVHGQRIDEALPWTGTWMGTRRPRAPATRARELTGRFRPTPEGKSRPLPPLPAMN